MSKLLIYFISSSLSLAVFMLVYLTFLRNNTRYNLCRFYLISSILLSFLIPSMPLDLGISLLDAEMKVHTIQLGELQAGTVVSENTLTDVPLIIDIIRNVDPLKFSLAVVLTVSLILLIRFFYRFGYIYLIQKKGKRDRYNETNLIYTDKTDNAFSFLGYIFINPLKFTDEEKRLIILHEYEHIRHLHSIDLILTELLIVFQWFNPFVYTLRRNLIEIHELIADDGVIRRGADPYSYQNLLLNVVTSSNLPGAGNQLSAFITKKRIAMIGQKTKPRGK